MSAIELAAKALFADGYVPSDRRDAVVDEHWPLVSDGVREAFIAKAQRVLRAAGLREEFFVVHAAGYPSGHSPWPNTLENARRFAEEHCVSGVTGQPVDPQPVVRRRLVSEWSDAA
jgi:hypothetical protein